MNTPKPSVGSNAFMQFIPVQHNERIYIRVGDVIYDAPPDELKAAVDAAVAALPSADAARTFPEPNLVLVQSVGVQDVITRTIAEVVHA